MLFSTLGSSVNQNEADVNAIATADSSFNGQPLRPTDLVQRVGKTAFNVIVISWVIAVLWLTLRPGIAISRLPWWWLGGGSLAGVDAVSNIVLFLPFGWLAARRRIPLRPVLFVALALTISIEFVQQWRPGRTTLLGDVINNVAGAAIGWRLGQPIRHADRRSFIAYGLLIVMLFLWLADTHWSSESRARIVSEGSWMLQTNGGDCEARYGEDAICISGVPSRLATETIVGSYAAETLAIVKWRPDSDLQGTCIAIRYHTFASSLRVRRPPGYFCGFSSSLARIVVSPRLEFVWRAVEDGQLASAWKPIPASYWLWPVWPFAAFRPNLLLVSGALVFLVGMALICGRARWIDGVGYLLALTVAAAYGGLGLPGWREVGAATAGVLLAKVAIRILTLSGHRLH